MRHDKFVPVFTDRDQVIYGKDQLVEDMNDRYNREAWTKEEQMKLWQK